MQGFRRAAVHLALVALFLRAFLPAGWMPNPTGATGPFLTICTGDGPVQQLGQHDHGKHTTDDGQHSHDECPFAAAPHLATPAAIAQIAQAALFARLANPPGVAVAAVATSSYQPQSPRAPPLTV